MNDNTPQPHHLWEVHAITSPEDFETIFLSWASFISFWNDPYRWRESCSSPPFEDYFEYDERYIQLMTLVRWHWVDDGSTYLADGKEPGEWFWDERDPTPEEIALEALSDGCLYLSFFKGRTGYVDQLMVRVNKKDEPLVKLWLKEQLDFVAQNLWYPIQVDGKKVTRVSDDWQEREVAVQLWADP